MVRTQILLTEEQARTLRRLSAERGVSMAVLVREAVEMLVRSIEGVPSAERQRRALEAIGRFASGHRDVSAQHDKHLQEAYHRQRKDRVR